MKKILFLSILFTLNTVVYIPFIKTNDEETIESMKSYFTDYYNQEDPKQQALKTKLEIQKEFYNYLFYLGRNTSGFFTITTFIPSYISPTKSKFIASFLLTCITAFFHYKYRQGQKQETSQGN